MSAQMNPGPDAQQKIIRRQVARLLQRAIYLVAVDESFSCERPDRAEEDPKSVVLDVETIQPLARGGGCLPLLFPKATHMQEVLERIKGGLDPLPEPNRQTPGIEHRTHVQEGIELLGRERWHVIDTIG